MKSLLCGLIISLCLVPAVAQQTTQLSGYVKYTNKTAAKGVVMTIGSYSVVTDANGYYKFSYLKPGATKISISPPGKRTRVFKITILTRPTLKDFPIDW